MKNLKSKKKKVFNGMTLVEVIVAIAILGVMTTVLVVVSQSINSYLRSANDVNGRVADQKPVAEVAYVNAETPTIPGDVKIVLQTDDGDITLTGKGYEVYNDAQMAAHSDEFGKGLNMKFITDIQAQTEAPTS